MQVVTEIELYTDVVRFMLYRLVHHEIQLMGTCISVNERWLTDRPASPKTSANRGSRRTLNVNFDGKRKHLPAVQMLRQLGNHVFHEIEILYKMA